MKKLILTSDLTFITNNNIDKLLPKKLTECKIAYITTASKKVFDTNYVDLHKYKMDEIGLNYTEIDIADKNKNELRDLLTGYDIILVEGGNTFYLQKCIRNSSFKEVLDDLLNKGVIYIGSSAGSYVMSSSIIAATWNERGFDRFDITDFAGMNYVPFAIKAHSTKKTQNEFIEKAKETNIPFRILTDKQALFVQDDNIQFLGEDKEIII